MQIVLLCILLSTGTEPADSMIFSRGFDRIEYYHNALYAAPLIGKSIFRVYDSDSLQAFSFTDEVNYRIRDFRLTPFTIYINRGSMLEKYYITSGIREAVFISSDISSFDLSAAEEIVLADRKRHELLFLDFTYQVKFKIENILIEDLRWHDDLLYVLTKNGVHIYDEYGNLIEKKPTPEICNRINVVNHKIAVFNEKADYIYLADAVWVKKEFPYTILDICESRESLIILDGNGTIVHVLDRNNF
ncbi:MAG: hypothetical protein OEV79_09760 [candidate division WOR-3 bacterium]|nr:hypothetical protein [candidate division WOR-3 bacterium]